MSEEWASLADQIVDEHYELMIGVRRHLHQHPEPSGQELATTRYVQRCLGEHGVVAKPVPTGRGLIVDSAAEGPRIALRADMDALWIEDAKSVPYRSKVPGVMHACGHDGHTAVVSGALITLRELERKQLLPWPVPWRGVLQPAEETSQGALEMVSFGALEGVAGILALHMDSSRSVGTIGVRAGALTASCDELHIKITGQGGHTARPHEAIDPVAAVAQLITALFANVPRSIDSQDPVVLGFGHIVGGQSPNVIPQEVRLQGTLRTLSPKSREEAKAQIDRVVAGIARLTGAEIDVSFTAGIASVMNDRKLNDLLVEAGCDLLGADHVQQIPRPSMGGEDFANYLDKAPGAMFRLGCATKAPAPPLHSPEFDLDDRALAIGAKMLVRAAIAWARPAKTTEGGS